MGWLYTDTFDYDRTKGIVLSSPLKMRFHHAGRIEWSNANSLPALQKSGRKFIIFRATSETVQMVGKDRWDSTYRCEVLELKQ